MGSLSNHLSFKITYHREMKLVDLLFGYAEADSDWGTSSSSSLAFCMVMLYNKLPIMWKSEPEMQKTIALFMEEAKYYATFRWVAVRSCISVCTVLV